jgi:hypothetical protein
MMKDIINIFLPNIPSATSAALHLPTESCSDESDENRKVLELEV